ncbi:MAG: hypothetical protein AABY86_00890 [Bdellovibrionota bacterium]
MGKIFFFLLALVIGGLYYAKEKDLFNLDKVSGAKAPIKTEVPVDANGKPIRLPIFNAGDCINHSKEGWNFYKIVSYSEDNYSFKYCEKFKGCNPDLEKRHFTDFEKQYGPERKLEKCPQ